MTAEQEKLDFKRILPIFVIVLVDLLGLTIIIPLLPLYAASFGADPFTIGLIGAAYPTMQLIGGPLLGSLSDRFGRKPVLIMSQIGTFSGFVLLALANALPLVLLSRLIDGLSGANIVAAQAAITDVTTPKTRTQGLGLIGAAFGLGFTLGPALAGISLALSGNNYHVPAILAAGFSFGSILLTMFWFKETNTVELRQQRAATENAGENALKRFTRAMRNPLIAALLVMVFLYHLVFGGFENLVSLFNLNRLGLNASGNTALFVFIGLVVVYVQGYAIGKWSRRFGERKLVLAGFLLLGIGLILASLTPHQPVTWYSRDAMINELTRDSSQMTNLAVELPDDANTGLLGFAWLFISLIPVSVGGGILSPSLNSLITRRVNPTEVGAILGVSASMTSLANAITPLVGGGLFQVLGSTAPFLIGGIFMLILFTGAMRFVPASSDEHVPLPVSP